MLHQPLTLPCGAVLRNRIAKAAMSEQLADRHGSPTPGLNRLYATWSRGGAGLLITGNVMISSAAFTEPRNAVLEDPRHLPAHRAWADAVHAHGAAVWMQINHPGRAAVAPLSRRPVAPSAVRLPVPGYNLRRPRALTGAEITEIVGRFARTAELAVAAGFDGVQIHAAHGYLLSQFLSPAANRRTDAYGGEPSNRRRLLLDVVRAVRASVGPGVPVGVKLNAADFHRGGLTQEESLHVALALADEGIDLLEVSGGDYQSPAMTGLVEGVGHRDAYFLEYARQLTGRTTMPIMLTGGIRTRAAMNELLSVGTVDVIGLGRPLAFHPDIPRRLLAGEDVPALPAAPRTGYRPADSYLELAWHNAQFHRIAAGSAPRLAPGPFSVVRGMGRVTAAALTQAGPASGS
ncbi:NADH oxidase [Actinomadura rubteroloni]|uniref:NADH oxidase n=1 Tax=Actinomadura rubteroloni TaxID=1926885 RepID=A0A2P4UM02_9ACTN|nr:NADH:flavin oxidoreductase/NADH oxidase family protein [Actinomadura rubteroloni]POM26077.1 NADH oxidase [Actinomadura rubteroloni]